MNKLERQGIARLIDTFGAEILVNFPDYKPLPKLQRAHLRVLAADTIEACTNCDLHLGCRQPVPPRWPGGSITTRAQVVVIGESPTVDDDKAGEPFTGRIGRIVKSGLLAAGLDPDDTAWSYVNACRAHDEDVQRPPTAREQALCRENLMATIAAADAKYVLLFGGVAVHAWRDDVKVSQVAGKLFTWDNRFVWPMWSVQAVLRDTFPVVTWRAQMSQFGQIVADDSGTDALHDRCIECSEPVHGYDPNGLPWCRLHLSAHVGRAATQDARRSKHEVNQLSMLGRGQ